MEPRIVKNRRDKMSPGGIITLTVAGRKTLGMKPGEPASVAVSVRDSSVILQPAGEKGGFPMSANGQFQFKSDAKAVLEKGEGRHYWLELHDAEQTVVMHPYT